MKRHKSDKCHHCSFQVENLADFEHGQNVCSIPMAEHYDTNDSCNYGMNSHEQNTDFGVQCEFENNETERQYNGDFNSQEDADLVTAANISNFEATGEDQDEKCDEDINDEICHFEMIEVVLQSSDIGAENADIVGKMIRTEDLPQLIFEANQCENENKGFIIDETCSVDVKNEAQICGELDGESMVRSLRNMDQICREVAGTSGTKSLEHSDQIHRGENGQKETVSQQNERQIYRKDVGDRRGRRVKGKPQMYIQGYEEGEKRCIKTEADLYEVETDESDEEAGDSDPDYHPLQEGINIEDEEDLEDNDDDDDNNDYDLDDKPKTVKRKKRARSSKNHNPLQCNRCSKSFTTVQDLKDHKMDHQKKKYHCATCNKNFILKQRFLKHMEKHLESIACKECGKKFRDMEALLRHEKIHTGVKPYACDLCGKR